jgi:DNA-binding transcriptional regulator YiaG
MSGTSTWKAIREKRVGDDPARVERARQALLAELNLAKLRKRRKVSQAVVAEKLAVSQANVSQLERGDIKFSTLAGYVEALGGQLRIQAVFSDEIVSFCGPLEDVRGAGGKFAYIAMISGSENVITIDLGQHEIAANAKALRRGLAGRSQRP